MKEYENEWHLELADSIRANRLIRGEVDFGGFSAWYDSLSLAQRGGLVSALCQYAYQAGVDEKAHSEAISAAGLPADDAVVLQARKVWKQWVLDLPWLKQLFTQLTEPDRFKLFRIFVYLFAAAEGRVFRQETKAHCNHWWHRDLLDDRVVQDLLSDPKFYMTSMKSDDKIKRDPR